MRELHGKSGTPEHRSWKAMITRCYNKNQKTYKNYGGRGIKVCDRWRNSFTAFLEDMGPKPSKKHSIDRINNVGDYEPGNCRWATPTEQMNNTGLTRRFEYNNSLKTIRQLSEESGVDLVLLKNRINKGMSLEKSLTDTPLNHKYLTCNGVTKRLFEWSKDLSIPASTLLQRINNGWSECDALVTPAEKIEPVLIKFNGKSQSLIQWSKDTGIPATTLRGRRDLGWSVERMLTETYSPKRKLITYEGETKLVSEWAKDLGMSFGTLYSRLEKGWTVQDAFTRPVEVHKKK